MGDVVGEGFLVEDAGDDDDDDDGDDDGDDGDDDDGDDGGDDDGVSDMNVVHKGSCLNNF